MDFPDFFCVYIFFLDFLDFIFKFFWIFLDFFLDFFWSFWILLKVTNVTTGHQNGLK